MNKYNSDHSRSLKMPTNSHTAMNAIAPDMPRTIFILPLFVMTRGIDSVNSNCKCTT